MSEPVVLGCGQGTGVAAYGSVEEAMAAQEGRGLTEGERERLRAEERARWPMVMVSAEAMVSLEERKRLLEQLGELECAVVPEEATLEWTGPALASEAGQVEAVGRAIAEWKRPRCNAVANCALLGGHSGDHRPRGA